MTTTTVTQGRVTWTNILAPTSQDIRELAARYPQFHPLNLQDCLAELEYPKLDHYDNYLFMVFQFPVWNAELKLYRPAEVDVFVASGVLVTAHRGELLSINDLFKRMQADESARVQFMARGASPLLYSLLNALVDTCFPILHEVGHSLRQVEQALFNADTRRTLNDITRLRRDLIALRHIVRPQIDVVTELERGTWPFIHEDLDLYWSDIANHLEQIRSTLDESVEVVSGLSETVDTLASHRIDEVIRLLTIVTILTLPLTLLATIFGMNIVMPYSEHPALFYSILFLGFVFTVCLLWYLRRRNWL